MVINKIRERIKKLPKEIMDLHWVWKLLIIIAIFCLFLKSVLFTVLLLAVLIRLIFVTNDHRNQLLIASLFACILFLSTPQLLKIGFVYNLVDTFFSGLQYSDYKSSVIESIGAILGTFLAITGAIWTQRIIDMVNECKERKIAATIIYYDFEFALNDFQRILERYNDNTPRKSNILCDVDCVKCFADVTKRYRVYIDDSWITNVARLTGCLSADDIKSIYGLYGDFTTIKSILNSNSNSDSDYDAAYRLIYHMFNVSFSLNGHPRTEANLKTHIYELLSRIGEIAEITSSNITNKEIKQ